MWDLGGHHGSTHMAVFSEPELTGAGRKFEPDFMWITRSTSLITPILIEIEKPSKRWFRQNGRPTAEFTQAHDQLNDWRSWFARDANRVMFRDRYMFGERYVDRPIQPAYVLIYGRSEEFGPGGGHIDPASLRHKRDQQRAADESFMTFDSLAPRFDHADAVTVRMTATGAEAVAFSPMYGTDTNSGQVAADIRDIDAALDRTVMITDERRSYLKERKTRASRILWWTPSQGLRLMPTRNACRISDTPRPLRRPRRRRKGLSWGQRAERLGSERKRTPSAASSWQGP